MVFAVILSSIKMNNDEQKTVFRVFTRLLYQTTPMFTFYITFVSIVINYYTKTTSPEIRQGLEAFVNELKFAQPENAILSFVL